MQKPSVTQLLDLLAKPALISWANKQGLAGVDIDTVRTKTRNAGTSLHSQIESRSFADAEHADNFARFMCDKELIDQEQAIETEWFVGRYDARIKWRGLTYLVDYKKSRRGRVYFEHRLQLAAYGMGVQADRFAIVAVPAFTPIEVKLDSQRKTYEGIIIALAHIWQAKQEVGE